MKLPWKPLAAATAAIGILAITTVIHPLPRVIWNASASVPIGLYAVDPRRSPTANENCPPRPKLSAMLRWSGRRSDDRCYQHTAR